MKIWTVELLATLTVEAETKDDAYAKAKETVVSTWPEPKVSRILPQSPDLVDGSFEQDIEDHIQAKGLEAPRVKPTDLDEAIDPLVAPQYYVFPGTTTTVCLLRLRNGYAVIGESSAVSLDNFDEGIGREVAFKKARNKLWPLLGYALKEKLASQVSEYAS